MEAGQNNQPLFFSEGVKSDGYLKFIVHELKPFIDKTYSTMTGRENTFTSGSSMGGLISLYAICEYPDVFGGAACLSTHWIGTSYERNNPIPSLFMVYLENNLPDPAVHKLYFDYGTETLDSLYEPYQLQADSIIVSRGYNVSNFLSLKFNGKDHSEISWAERLHIPLVFLLSREGAQIKNN
jgi:predicted alpha/beta superfamily hydrolase